MTGTRTRKHPASKAVMIIAVLALLASWFITMAPPAKANPICDAIGGAASWKSWQPDWYGQTGGSLLNGGAIYSIRDAVMGGKPWGNEAHTAYEWYGMAGMRWTSDYTQWGQDEDADDPAKVYFGENCLPMKEMIVGNIAGSIFGWSTTISNFFLTIFGWASDTALTDAAIEPIGKLIKRMQNSFYLNFAVVLVLLAALWLGWQGLVKSRGRDTVTGVVWMVVSMALTLAFFAAPAAYMKTAMDQVNVINELTMETATGVNYTEEDGVDMTGLNGMCSLPKSADDRGKRVSQCLMYKTFAFDPWSAGQFGADNSTPFAPGPNIDFGTRAVFHKKVTDLRMLQLDQMVYDRDEVAVLMYGKDQQNPTPGSPEQLSNDVQEQLVDDFFDNSPRPTAPPEEDAKAPIELIRDDVMGRDAGRYGLIYSGRDADTRLGVAIAAFVGSIVGGIVVFIISFYLLLLRVGFLLLVALSPIFLLIGLHPGMGRRLLIRYLEAVLGTLAKMIIVGFLLAILMGIYSVLLGDPTVPWMARLFLITAVGIAAMVYRKRLTDMLNFVNLGGGGGSDFDGQQMQRPFKKGASAVTGGATQGVTQAGAGGGLKGFMGGAVMGTMMGARSGSAMGTAGQAFRRGKARGSAQGRQDDRATDTQSRATGAVDRANGARAGADATVDQLIKEVRSYVARGQVKRASELAASILKNTNGRVDLRPHVTTPPGYDASRDQAAFANPQDERMTSDRWLQMATKWENNERTHTQATRDAQRLIDDYQRSTGAAWQGPTLTPTVTPIAAATPGAPHTGAPPLSAPPPTPAPSHTP